MATKKTNTKASVKSSTKKEETAKGGKSVEEMSVDELTEIFKSNDTKEIKRLEKENAVETSEPEMVETVEPIVETKPVEEETVVNEEIHEDVVEPEPEPVIEKVEEKKTVEKPVEEKNVQPTIQTPNTNRSVYGYDHFGMIYGY